LRKYRRTTVSAGIVVLFGLTMFLSAALLFDIQPMYAKMLLPLVGGAPAVWNTVVVFFQLGLLLGYLLAHVLRSYVPLKAQTVGHVALAALAIALLPFRLVAANASAIADPVPFVLLSLLAGAGLPFLVISATAPLLQSWFARIGHPRSHDPYFFYAASNAGSLLGLAAYPLLMEPFFGIALQGRIWAAAYCALVGGLAICGFVAWRFGADAPGEDEPSEVAAIAGEPPTWKLRLRWIALAFVPASLSLAMTTHITNEVAPIPLLWTLPLGIYLLTFVIAFSRRPILTPERIARVLPYAILPLALLVMLGGALPASLDVAFNLIALFLIALTCHGELSASRPPAHYLTGFYVVLAVGGMLGGLFNALVAPYVFRTIAEYPLTLVLACAILPTLGVIGGPKRQRFFDVAAPVLLGAAMLLVYAVAVGSIGFGPWLRIGFSLAAVVCFAFVGRRVRFALGIGVLFLVAALLPSQIGYKLEVARNFFGAKLTVDNPNLHWHEFIHSGTVHGIESTEPALRTMPLAYYSKDGPLGSIFTAARSDKAGTHRVGIVGLGVGSVACYRLPGEDWTFFEIDPQVVSLAQNTKLFWYLPACAPNAKIVVGDGRLELANVSPNEYDLLILDAYSSDQPPLHMLTSEAFALFTSRVATGGFIAFHISNRYFNLAPVVGNLAASVGWQAWIDRDDNVSRKGALLGEMESQWVVVAREASDVRAIASGKRWHQLARDPTLRTWTDDYSSLLLVMNR
jgi:spermidine synthase